MAKLLRREFVHGGNNYIDQICKILPEATMHIQDKFQDFPLFSYLFRKLNYLIQWTSKVSHLGNLGPKKAKNASLG